MEPNLVTQAVLACLSVDNRDLNDPRQVAALIVVQTSLASIFGALAAGIANEGSHRGWSADKENAGYLRATIRNVDLRAPWHLIADLPDADALEETVGHAERVRFAGDCVMCLSGSMVMRGGIIAAGDIDFCEYVSSAHDFSSVSQQAMATSDREVACFRIGAHIADGLAPPFIETTRPWPNAATDAFLQRARWAPTGKCDFVLVSRTEGTIELTKIVLHVDGRYPDTEGAWELSFPYQEIALDRGSWVPRRLASPRSLGKYVAWLFRQIEKQAEAAPWKAAKRALALARILHHKDLGEAAQRVLRRDDLALMAVLGARLQFYQRLSAIEDSALESFRQSLGRTIEDLATTLDIPFRRGDAQSSPGASVAEIAARMGDIPSKSAEMDEVLAGFRAILEPALRSSRY